MHRSFVGTVLLAAACALPLPARAQGTSSAQLPQQVDAIAKQVLQQTGVPSASVAVVKDGKLVYEQAYGDSHLNPDVPARPDQRYAIGSISKQITSAAILLLQEEGKLSLDDPVSRFLPDLTRADEVTIRELLSHTSGYQDFWPQDYVPPLMQTAMPPQAILDRWAKQPLDFDPGTRWQYSNTNYVIAAQIVEKASGEPYFQFIRERIIEPLGLESAIDFDAGNMADTDASPYMRFGLGPLRPAPDEGPGWMAGAGELAMTASDLARWDISIIDQSLLSPASYHALESEVPLKNGVGTGYALGLDVSMQGGRRVLEHSGEVSGFTAENIVFPDDGAAVVVLTNQDAAPAAGAIAQQVGQILFTTEDDQTESRTARARAIFQGLQQGKIDRSLFTSDANAYFSAQALQDFASTLAPLGAPTEFVQTGERLRGGMKLRVYRVVFPTRTLRVWTYEMPDGKLEQYQIAPAG